MIGSKIFRRHYWITTIILVGFIIIGILVNFAFMKSLPKTISPPSFFAKMADAINAKDRKSALIQMDHWSEGQLPLHFSIVDQSGSVIYPEGETLPFDWDRFQKPTSPYESVFVKQSAGPFPSRDEIVRLSGEPAQYLYSRFLPDNKNSPLTVFLTTIGFLFVSLLLGIAVSLLVLYRSIGEKVREADDVIRELKCGNLKARFKIKKRDEVGEAMGRFNEMADEVERLIERLRGTEKARVALLQDLAHDLRTPVASMQTMIETLLINRDRVSAETRDRFLLLSLEEIKYFERLVEDLLILAQVSEPRYQISSDLVQLGALIQDEIGNLDSMNQGGHKKISVKTKGLDTNELVVLGSVHLIRRMLRNALHNAWDFARSNISIELSQVDETNAQIRIQDDGPGLSEEAMKQFGIRRFSRTIGEKAETGTRVSVGLGSVIMKTVAEVHGGQLNVANGQTKDLGTILTITLPHFYLKAKLKRAAARPPPFR